MTKTVAPYGLDDPSAYDHYGDFTAMLAGHLVERNPMLDVLLDALADACDEEYGLSDEQRSLLSEAIAETNLLDHIEYGHIRDEEEWIVENSYSGIEPADYALFLDVQTEMRDFVAQRWCDEQNA